MTSTGGPNSIPANPINQETPTITCTCASTPPTMPTCRADHLFSCALVQASQAARLLWMEEVMKDPKRAAVEMSGMSDDDLDELRREFRQRRESSEGSA